jgi:elongation factor G
VRQWSSFLSLRLLLRTWGRVGAGAIVGNLNRRKGVIQSSEQEGEDVIIQCHVPLNEMFGYSTDLRSMTQGKGEFTMEYASHEPVAFETQKQLVDDYTKTRFAKQT